MRQVPRWRADSGKVGGAAAAARTMLNKVFHSMMAARRMRKAKVLA